VITRVPLHRSSHSAPSSGYVLCNLHYFENPPRPHVESTNQTVADVWMANHMYIFIRFGVWRAPGPPSEPPSPGPESIPKAGREVSQPSRTIPGSTKNQLPSLTSVAPRRQHVHRWQATPPADRATGPRGPMVGARASRRVKAPNSDGGGLVTWASGRPNSDGRACRADS
jgi:hypothetical protein